MDIGQTIFINQYFSSFFKLKTNGMQIFYNKCGSSEQRSFIILYL